MEEIVIKGPNRVGFLADVSEALGERGINIESIAAYGEGERAIIKLITNDITSTKHALAKFNDIELEEKDVFLVELDNKPGELAKLTRRLANKNVNLESVYVIGGDKDVLKVVVVPSEQDYEKAEDVLARYLE